METPLTAENCTCPEKAGVPSAYTILLHCTINSASPFEGDTAVPNVMVPCDGSIESDSGAVGSVLAGVQAATVLVLMTDVDVRPRGMRVVAAVRT